MNKPHLSEEEIQQAATEPTAFTHELLVHLQGCDDCKAKVANYRMVFAELASLPEVVADPGLETAIMDKVAGERAGFKWSGVSITFLSGLAASAVITLVWLNPQLFSLVLGGLRTNLALLVFFTTVMIAGFYGWLIYKKHTQQMHLLDKL